jgi:hypothetical protein
MPDDRRRHVPRKPPPAVPDPASRRLDALRRLAERPGTPAEGDAALAAIERISAQRPPTEPLRPSSFEPEIRFTNVGKPPSQPSPHLLDVLAGLRIQLERTPDRLRHCCRRGCIAVLRLEDDLLPGDVPTYTLRCDACARHLGYLHTRLADELRTRVEQGRASCPILRDTGLLR